MINLVQRKGTDDVRALATSSAVTLNKRTPPNEQQGKYLFM